MTRTVFAVAFGVLALATGLPQVPSARWIFRAWDFPRLQVAFLALFGASAAAAAWASGQGAGWWPLPFLALAAAQARFLWPFTPLHARVVPDAEPARPVLRVALANVRQENRRHREVLERLRSLDADVVWLYETDGAWCRSAEGLADAYPFRRYRALDNAYGMAVLAREAPEAFTWTARVREDIPSARGRWRLDGRPITLVSVHPRPPFLPESASSAERDAELLLWARELAGNGEALALCGDFNDVPWSRTVRGCRSLSGLLDPRLGRGWWSTFHADWPFLRWPLDQCLVRPGLAVAGWRREPLPGSDHFALVVDLARCDRDPDPGAQAGHEPAGRVREHLVEALSERQEGAAG